MGPVKVTIELTDDEATGMRRWRAENRNAHRAGFLDVRVAAMVADALPEPLRIAVGDRVRVWGPPLSTATSAASGYSRSGVVIGVDDEVRKAWVRFSPSERFVVSFDYLAVGALPEAGV